MNGINYQFGATPELGCQDTVLTLKSFLQKKRKKIYALGLCVFDLVKACNSVQHIVIANNLEILGVPPKIMQ